MRRADARSRSARTLDRDHRQRDFLRTAQHDQVTGTTDTALTADGVYQVLKFYGKKIGISVDRFGPHSARATAATNALDAGADIAKVQEWLGHANVSTTRVYDHRKARSADPCVGGPKPPISRSAARVPK